MGFIGKRIFVMIITLFLVSVLTFGALRIIPGDAAVYSLGTEATPEQLASLRAEMGFDKGPFEQYFSWLKGFLTGDMGNSARFRGASVSGIIAERLPVTFFLALLSFFFIIVISLPLSLFTVQREGSFVDRVVTSFSAINVSIPGFFLGIVFVWIFGIVFKLFVPGAFITYSENSIAFFGCLFFPALAIALPNSALVIKFLRASIFREFKSDYARTARGKGGRRSYILWRHILKNASLPAITLLGMIAAEVFSGSIVIEQVFGIPGIGRLLIASITSRDYLMVETLMIYIAFIVILANTLADIILQIVDPRIRLAEKL